jgi:hypothetical protein
VEPPKLNSGLDALEPEECFRLLATETVGRLGVVVDGQPEIFPVNFALAGEHIVIRTDPGVKLTAAMAGPLVFEVDHLDEATRTGWSVMVHGSAQVTGGPGGRPGSQNRVLRSWREADLPYQMRIMPRKITGRRINIPGPHRWPAAGSSGGDAVPEP